LKRVDKDETKRRSATQNGEIRILHQPELSSTAAQESCDEDGGNGLKPRDHACGCGKNEQKQCDYCSPSAKCCCRAMRRRKWTVDEWK
jgi:hypothetical protein